MVSLIARIMAYLRLIGSVWGRIGALARFAWAWGRVCVVAVIAWLLLRRFVGRSGPLDFLFELDLGLQHLTWDR